MATRVIMPQLGETVVEGTVSKWLKQEGEAVEALEPLVEITTDKVDTEIPSPAAGALLKIYVGEGLTVKAGTLLAHVGQPGEALPDETPAKHAGASSPQPIAPAAQASTVSQPSSTNLGLISPIVARLAAEHGVDLAQVQGTGGGGRITKKDVLAFVEKRQGPAGVAAPAGDIALPLTNVRKAIAEHMVRSKQTAPHVTTVMEADLSRVVAHREAHKAQAAQDGIRLTFTAYFVLASAAALKSQPQVNSTWGNGEILLKKDIHIGVAAATDEGLIVPVIKHAGEKSLLEIAAEMNDLSQRARTKRLKPDEVSGGTFTVTNHGVSGSLFATPIIHQPQCAILGIGAIEKRVKVIDDALAIRPMTYLSLTFDHRLIDGAIADAFLSKVKETLEEWGGLTG